LQDLLAPLTREPTDRTEVIMLGVFFACALGLVVGVLWWG
jgi:hypothetical protein